jgi:SAM-dependent methyltransferase
MSDMIGVNLGSGQRPFSSCPRCAWINVDSQPKWNPDITANGAHLPMIQNDSVDVVVAHHVLEHFGCGEASAMLRECWRILKVGGSLLVFVPDMRALAQRWLTRQLDTQVYMTNVYGAYMGDEADRHKWGFDRESLCRYLNDVQVWDVVKPFDWRTIPGADIAGPDFWIQGLECVK